MSRIHIVQDAIAAAQRELLRSGSNGEVSISLPRDEYEELELELYKVTVRDPELCECRGITIRGAKVVKAY